MSGLSVPSRTFFLHLSRPLLARLLAPFESDLAARGFSVSALGASSADDRALPLAVHDLLDAGSASEDLAAAIALLSSVARASTPTARDALIRLDVAAVLPRRLGPEDLAATAYLDHPALFSALRVAPAADAIRSFVLFAAPPPPESPPSFDAASLAAASRALGAWFDSKHRSAVCEIHVRRRDGELHFEITHGSAPVTHELIDEANAMRVVTQVNAQRSHAVYYEETRVLAVHALEFIKDGIRRSFGIGCGGGEAFFTKAALLLDTSPLVLDLDAALAPDAELGVTGVELRWIDVVAADGSGASYWAPKGDVRGSRQNALLRAALAEEGVRASYVKIAVELATAKRARVVELSADRNQLVYDRRDAEVEKTLLALLARRGIWLGGERVERVQSKGGASVEPTHGEDAAASWPRIA